MEREHSVHREVRWTPPLIVPEHLEELPDIPEAFIFQRTKS